MGDEVLKTNKILILSLFMVVNLLASVNNNVKAEIKEYDTLFEQIGEKRVGVSNSEINIIKNPFIMTDVKKIIKDGNMTKIKTVKYVLNAIFNKKAKINDKWYKLGSEMGDFKLTKVGSESVIINNGHSKKELFIRKSNVGKIKFSSK